jgi:hypothetical protein
MLLSSLSVVPRWPRLVTMTTTGDDRTTCFTAVIAFLAELFYNCRRVDVENNDDNDEEDHFNR